MAKVKVRRTHREELPGIVVLRDASALPGSDKDRPLLDLDMGADPELDHLISHDPDGFFTVVDRDETLGFAAAHIRSRQCILSQIWVLPQHRGLGAGEALMNKVIAFADRSGVRELLALVPADGAIQGLLLVHGFAPIVPVYHLRLDPESAESTVKSLSQLLPSEDVTQQILNQHGKTDLDRIDRLTRNISRSSDHLYWIKSQDCRTTFVRQGSRIAAYGLGGPHQVGPVAGSTQDAALAALGHALLCAFESKPASPVEVRIPAHFKPAVESLMEAGARIHSTSIVFGRETQLKFDRLAFGTTALP